jgi:hypothetical protein
LTASFVGALACSFALDWSAGASGMGLGASKDGPPG